MLGKTQTAASARSRKTSLSGLCDLFTLFSAIQGFPVVVLTPTDSPVGCFEFHRNSPDGHGRFYWYATKNSAEGDVIRWGKRSRISRNCFTDGTIRLRL